MRVINLVYSGCSELIKGMTSGIHKSGRQGELSVVVNTAWRLPAPTKHSDQRINNSIKYTMNYVKYIYIRYV
jgi:hypothetical protein